MYDLHAAVFIKRRQSLRGAKHFVVMADETKDISHKEQLLICMPITIHDSPQQALKDLSQH
jgi:hypothetical protein